MSTFSTLTGKRRDIIKVMNQKILENGIFKLTEILFGKESIPYILYSGIEKSTRLSNLLALFS